MPRPLGPEPDSVPIHEQVRELMRKAYTDRMAPVGIVFSQEGYSKAQGQNVPGMQAFTGGQGQHHVTTHYLGFPFTVSTSLTTGDVLLDLVPGGSDAAKAFRQTTRDARAQAGARPDAVRVTAKGPMDRPTIEVLAEGLSLVQMSDLAKAWADANPGPLADALAAAVQAHGRFE